MKKITYKDLQLKIEQELFAEIDHCFNGYSNDYDGEKLSYKEERQFYELIKYALEVKEHYAVDAILKRVTENLDLKNISLRLFVYQDNTFNVNCFTRKTDNNTTQLQIFVSQHFFNNLNEDEQVGIIGHEIAHFLFNHFKYPARELINYPFSIGDIGDLKSNLIYHSKLSEITSDIIGLVANDFNCKAYSTALIKFSTGLNDSANSLFSITPLIDIVLKQYDDYANDMFFYNSHSTHPLMPVRVKIINSVAKSDLVKHFGNTVSDKDYELFKKEYDELINSIIKNIYPELYPHNSELNKVLIPLAVAVMLSDKKIDEKEISVIQTMIKRSDIEFPELMNLMIPGRNMDFQEIHDKLIDDAITKSKQNSFDKRLIVPAIRKLLIVAASDGKIEKAELETIYKYAKEFDISRNELILMIKTQYKV